MTDKQDSPDMREKVNKLIEKAILDYNLDTNPECAFKYYVPSITDQIQALYAPVIEQAKKSGYDQHVKYMFSIEDAQSLRITELKKEIEQAVKAEHDRMIKCCVDEGNDAYKRGVEAGKVARAKEERERKDGEHWEMPD